MTNENEEKIATIKGYLAQANCAGVEVEATNKDMKFSQTRVVTNNTTPFWWSAIEHSSTKILSIKPIPIELEPLHLEDLVWVNNELGRIDGIYDTLYRVSFGEHQETHSGKFERHELLKVAG